MQLVEKTILTPKKHTFTNILLTLFKQRENLNGHLLCELHHSSLFLFGEFQAVTIAPCNNFSQSPLPATKKALKPLFIIQHNFHQRMTGEYFLLLSSVLAGADAVQHIKKRARQLSFFFTFSDFLSALPQATVTSDVLYTCDTAHDSEIALSHSKMKCRDPYNIQSYEYMPFSRLLYP